MALPIEFLHWAGMNDDCLDKVKELVLTQPELLNSVNSFQDNALIIAARTGNKAIAQYLISTNIDIQHRTTEGNAFLIALDTNRREIAKMLIDDGRIDLFCLDHKQQNALFSAAKHGDDDMIEFLVDKGLDINHLNDEGNHVLFPFMEGYTKHENYWCFEVILSLMKPEIIFQNNRSGINIIDFMNWLEEDALEQNNFIRHKRLQKNFIPLRNVLQYRLENMSE